MQDLTLLGEKFSLFSGVFGASDEDRVDSGASLDQLIDRLEHRTTTYALFTIR
ncbi:MAG: hypothetical protein ACKVQU_00315 [Burkholderiales bacterium]